MSPTSEQIENYVAGLIRAELGMEPTDRELARGCAALAACLLESTSRGFLRLPPVKEPREAKAPPKMVA